MTIQQASAVNTIWRFLTDRRSLTGNAITRDEVAAALRPLAKAAHKTLGAGVTEDQICASAITALETIDEELEIVTYTSERDGYAVVEINHPSYLRVIVGEGAVFDGHTEGK